MRSNLENAGHDRPDGNVEEERQRRDARAHEGQNPHADPGEPGEKQNPPVVLLLPSPECRHHVSDSVGEHEDAEEKDERDSRDPRRREQHDAEEHRNHPA